jgi:hypothetical protein
VSAPLVTPCACSARARWSRIVAALGVASIVVAVLPGCSRSHEDVDPALVLGDSLTAFSSGEVAAASRERDTPLVVRAVPGAALCDFLPEAERLLRDEKFSAIVLEFAGNNVTPCVEGLTGSALVDRYERHTRRVIAWARTRRVPVVLLGPPAMDFPPLTVDAGLLNERFRRIARDTPAVRYVDLRRTLSPHGFTLTLPCTDAETHRAACRDGRIPVRSRDGVHFDVPGLDGYSSGATRFAEALVDAARNPD